MDVLYGMRGILSCAFHTVMFNLFQQRSVGFSYSVFISVPKMLANML